MTGTRPPVRATFVMYHYVRPLAASRFPRLAALDVDAFRGQLAYITRHYAPVSCADVIAAVRGDHELPRRPIVLTFDDGYAEHYGEVWPLLRAARVSGTFFLAASALIERRVLDVNKIQFILAAAERAETVVDTIEDAIAREAGRGGVKTVAEYRAAGWIPVRYDSPAASYVKYLLQGALPEELRARLLDSLFAAFVSADERAFAEELYLSAIQARDMVADGMTIGCHADRHVTLTSLSRDGQAREIDGALRVLDAVGLTRSSCVFSYAKGAHNADSLDLLRERGCLMSVTNRPEIATIPPDRMLALPRLDTRHLPVDALAPPNEWTNRA